MRHALLIAAALLAAPAATLAQQQAAKPKPAAAAGPAVEIDRASFNGPTPPGALKTAEASRALAADAFSRVLKQGAPKAKAIKRLKLAWGGGATEPVAWAEGGVLTIQHFWDAPPKRADLVFAIGCAFNPGKGACAEQGD